MVYQYEGAGATDAGRTVNNEWSARPMGQREAEQPEELVGAFGYAKVGPASVLVHDRASRTPRDHLRHLCGQRVLGRHKFVVALACPILLALDLLLLDTLAQHHDTLDTLAPNHRPKVRHSVGKRALCANVGARAEVVCVNVVGTDRPTVCGPLRLVRLNGQLVLANVHPRGVGRNNICVAILALVHRINRRGIRREIIRKATGTFNKGEDNVNGAKGGATNVSRTNCTVRRGHVARCHFQIDC